MTARWVAAVDQSRKAQGRPLARSVRLDPLPSGADGTNPAKIPEWRSGLRSKLPVATTFEQRDGVLVSLDKYPDAIARSYERACSLERREQEAVRQRARELDVHSTCPFDDGGLAAGGGGHSKLPPLQVAWLYASIIRGEAIVEPDEWLE